MDIVDRLRKRQMMQDVRGTGDRFNKQIAVPDPFCQSAADEIERLRAVVADAADEIASWASYASEYFQKKHDLEGTLQRFRDAAKGGKE